MNAEAIATLVAVGVTVGSGILASTWYLGNKIGNIEGIVTTIKDNDLAHIYERLGNVESVIMEGNLVRKD